MSEGPPRWSEVSDEEANQYGRDPARRVTAPAQALLVVGCLGILTNVFLASALSALKQDPGRVERPAGMDDETFRANERGRAAAPLVDCCLIGVPTLAVYPLVIVAAIRMRGLHNHWLAVFGSVLAMAPCSLIVVVGLPVGVWSLVVLANADVRAAFAGRR